MVLLVLTALIVIVGGWQGAEAATWTKDRPQEIRGSYEPIRSPNGRLELIWKEESVEKHQIRIRRVGDLGLGALVYSFNRTVDVLWAPNGRMVAITDRLGSNISEVVVLDVSPYQKLHEQRDFASGSYGFNFDEFDKKAFSHSYAEVMRWSHDSRRLQVRLRAYNAEDRKSRALN